MATRAIHGPAAPSLPGSPLSPPIVQSSAFSFDNIEEMIEVFEEHRPGFVYTRYGNPTVEAVERKLAALEGGGFARLFASGMAAIHAALWSSVARGDLVVSGHELYGGTMDLLTRLLPRLGVSWKRTNLADPDAYGAALADRPTVVYFETPSNPLLQIIDGSQAVTLAHEAGAKVIVDNTLATPILQNPLAWGGDLVVHSATKYLGGHSDLTLGVVIGRKGDEAGIDSTRRSQGAIPDPFAAWLLNRGLMTLPIRIHAQSATAAIIAEALVDHAAIERVHYPGLGRHPGHGTAAAQMRGFGAMLAIDLHGGSIGAMHFLRGLRLIRLAPTLGGVESLATHPATSSHRTLDPEQREALGIGEGLVRISVGLEDAADLLGDIEQALRAPGGATR